jgi:hypothetical protein
MCCKRWRTATRNDELGISHERSHAHWLETGRLYGGRPATKFGFLLR